MLFPSNTFSPADTMSYKFNVKKVHVFKKICKDLSSISLIKILGLNVTLTLSWRRLLSYRNQSIDLLCKSMDWFLYDNGLRHERVNWKSVQMTKNICWNYNVWRKFNKNDLSKVVCLYENRKPKSSMLLPPDPESLVEKERIIMGYQCCLVKNNFYHLRRIVVKLIRKKHHITCHR